jgi:4-amino-4-deoxy-L-arabinose transferase-like glycosyltransferase
VAIAGESTRQVPFDEVRTLIKTHPRFFAMLTLAAIALRLVFVLRWPVVQGDALIYAELAKNLINEHVYGLARATGMFPTLIRLPGYPLFLAACFKLFGQDNFRAVMLVQLVLDMGTCFIVAETARRAVSRRAALLAFAFACLCPFTANYVGTALTETTEIFFTAAAVLCAILALERKSLGWWALCGASTAAAIQLRPDGGLVLISIGLVLLWKLVREAENRRHIFTASVVFVAVSLAPLVPWAIRNWKTFHVFQPLVTVSASDPDEFVPKGWNRWVNTWILDYSSTEDLTFNVSGTPIDVYALPSRAYDSPQEFLTVAQLFAEYNKTVTMSPEIDAQFGRLADERIHRHPLRQYFVLPVGRALDLWLRPRTEMLPLDTHWWDFESDIHDSSFATALGVLNLVLVLAAIGGAVKGRVRYLGLFVTYPIVRTLLLVKMAAVEDRYTLECFPILFVLAAAWWDRQRPGDAEHN